MTEDQDLDLVGVRRPPAERHQLKDAAQQQARGSEQVAKSKKIRTISMAPMIGEAIRRIANDESISKMFD